MLWDFLFALSLYGVFRNIFLAGDLITPSLQVNALPLALLSLLAYNEYD